MDCIETSLSLNPAFTHSVALKQLCLILLKDYAQLDYFLSHNPYLERPDECRVLYKLMHPEELIDIDVSVISSIVKEDFGAGLFPWQLFLLVYLNKNQLALDFLEKNVKLRTGQIVNFSNIPLLKPLHRYERFQALVQSTFKQELLPPQTQEAVEVANSKPLMSTHEIKKVSEILEKGMKDELWFQKASLS